MAQFMRERHSDSVCLAPIFSNLLTRGGLFKLYRIRYIFPAMPFRGIWTLQCQICHKDFTIAVKPGEQLVEFAKSYPCPSCKQKPDEHASSDAAISTWHRVLNFHSSSL